MKKKKPTREDWIYLAGLVEGDGCICIDNLLRLKLKITSTRKKMVNHLMSLYGGCIGTGKYKSSGKMFYMWTSKLSSMNEILNRIMPYLVIKKDQAELGLQFRETIGSTGIRLTPEKRRIRTQKRKEMYEQMKRLHRGSF